MVDAHVCHVCAVFFFVVLCAYGTYTTCLGGAWDGIGGGEWVLCVGYVELVNDVKICCAGAA